MLAMDAVSILLHHGTETINHGGAIAGMICFIGLSGM